MHRQLTGENIFTEVARAVTDICRVVSLYQNYAPSTQIRYLEGLDIKGETCHHFKCMTEALVVRACEDK